MHKYIQQRPAFGGRTELFFNVIEFAKDLSEAMGGRFRPDEDAELWYAVGRLVVRGVTIYVHADRGAKFGRASLSTGAPDLTTGGADLGHVDWPRCTVDPGRPMPALAKALQTTLVEPGVVARDALAAKIKAHNDHGAQLRRIGDALCRAHPRLTVAYNDAQGSAALHCSTPYIMARLNADGGIYFDRASVDADRAGAVLAAMLGEGPA